MKQIISTVTIIFFAVVVSPTRTFAQAEKYANAHYSVSSLQQYSLLADKKYFTETYRNDISIKAVRNFIRSFKMVTNEKWYKISGGFLASFKQNGITTEVYYNEKGTWLYNFLTYHEDHVPSQIRKMIKSKYDDYNIFIAHEYQIEDEPVYIIKIKNTKKFKTVMVSDGKMQVVEEYEQI